MHVPSGRKPTTPAVAVSAVAASDNRLVPDTKMIFLGFGKYVRADRIYALEPLAADERGSGARTRVWVDGIPEPLVASRTERSILTEMGAVERRPRTAPQGENLF